MVAMHEDKVDMGTCHNSQCLSHSAVSQLLVCSISLNGERISYLLQILV